MDSLIVPEIDEALKALLPVTRYEVRWMTTTEPDAVVQIKREQFSAIAPCHEYTELLHALIDAGYGRS